MAAFMGKIIVDDTPEHFEITEVQGIDMFGRGGG
jgi:hypothetical protein